MIYTTANVSGQEIGSENRGILESYSPFSPESKSPAVDNPTLAIYDNWPVIDGATAAYPVYASAAQALYHGFDPNTGELLNQSDASREYLDIDPSINIPIYAFNYVRCSTTSEAYASLIDGGCDLFFGAQPSEAQVAAAEVKGVALDMVPLGHEAFVFIVSADNPIESLTIAQIQDIYEHKITNWAELGGNDEQIIAYQRNAGSGSQTIMEAKVMAGRQMTAPLRQESTGSMGGAVDKVVEFHDGSNAIGYSFRFFVTNMYSSPNIKLLMIDGIEPSVENIANGSYPLTIDFYAVTATGTNRATNSHTTELIDWLVSTQGQKLIEDCGYVGLSAKLEE